ncbi:MlaE family ABC transporter permease [Tundrisphaera sp. TA3]|uniref:MlaE family ABC transporter permease n=1 Tax=Tundrisphaera sp. TA3 TaxID=3435775 RepID=UPI003EC0BC6F
MDDEPVSAIRPLTPAASLLAAPVGVIRYLGVLGLLGVDALSAARPSPSFLRETGRHFEGLLAMGLPLVAVVHVGMGSFLAMQAYFGATFLDGIGPVVGVGLVRNLAPLLAALTLGGIVTARYAADLRGIRDADGFDPAREASGRILAAALVGPVLAVWGAGVGIAVGFLVAHKMMGVTVPQFFDLFSEMLWIRDVFGLVGKGAVFALVSAWIACHEGLHDHGPIATSVCRAACLAALGVLVLNGGSFLLLYHAGPAFGPTVLTPPTGR